MPLPAVTGHKTPYRKLPPHRALETLDIEERIFRLPGLSLRSGQFGKRENRRLLIFLRPGMLLDNLVHQL